jgi:hypothetical protein
MSFADIGLNHYLVVSAILFALGVLIVATRRNAVAILMGGFAPLPTAHAVGSLPPYRSR